MHLLELFDTTIPIQWKRYTGHWHASFGISGVEYYFDAYEVEEDVWSISFKAMNVSYDKDSFGNLKGKVYTGAKVFGIVLSLLKDFVTTAEPYSFKFSANMNDSRHLLYQKMIKSMMPLIKRMGYSFRTEDTNYNMLRFIFTKDAPETITELFDTGSNISPKWRCIYRNRYELDFEINGQKYNIELQKLTNGWNVEFEDSFGNWGTTGVQKQNAPKVFGIVINSIAYFAKKHDAEGFRFFGFNDSGKDVFYIAMMKHMAKKMASLGYVCQHTTVPPVGRPTGTEFILTKKNHIKEGFALPDNLYWTTKSNELWAANFKIKNENYELFIFDRGQNNWDVAFKAIPVDGKFELKNTVGITGKMGMSAPLVYGTVISHVKDFIEHRHPDSLGFSAGKAHDRDRIYMRMLQHLAKDIEALGYHVKKPVELEVRSTFRLVKNEITEGFSGSPDLRSKIAKLALKYPKEIPLSVIFKNPTDKVIPMSMNDLFELYGTEPMIDEREARKLPTEMIDISKIILQDQGSVGVANLLALLDTEREIPLIWLEALPGDKYWLIEGHHRLALSVLSGKTEVLANVGRDSGILKQKIKYKKY